MTGLIEQIAADVAAIKAFLSQGQQPQQQIAPPQLLQQPLQTGFPVGGAGVALGGGAVQYPPATSEMITALITPHTENPNVMAALRAQMQGMGIATLPDAQPSQYGELYSKFQTVLQQVGAQQAQQPAAPASII